MAEDDPRERGLLRSLTSSRGITVIAGLAFAVLLWLAGRTVFEVVLLAIAVLFLLVVLLAAAVAWWLSSDSAPDFLRDATGKLLPFGRRTWALIREGIRRLSGKPWRTPERIVAKVSEQLDHMAWRSPQGWLAYNQLQVACSHHTWDRLDDWMALEDIAGQWAHSYSRARRRTARLRDRVRLVLVVDERVPDGAWRLQGSFQPAVAHEIVAEASAPLTGPPASAGVSGMRTPAAPAPDRSVPPTPDAAGQEGTRQWRPGATPADAPEGEEPTVMLFPNQSGEGAAALVLRRCDGSGRDRPGSSEIRITATGTVLGRDAGAGVRLDEPHVSRTHARLVLSAGHWAIEDLGSSFGTRLNDDGLPPRAPRPLAVGDVIQLADRDPKVFLRVVAT